MNGFSIYVCVGKYAGFSVKKDGFVLRVILGYVAIGIMATDLEIYMQRIHDALIDVGKG